MEDLELNTKILYIRVKIHNGKLSIIEKEYFIDSTYIAPDVFAYIIKDSDGNDEHGIYPNWLINNHMFNTSISDVYFYTFPENKEYDIKSVIKSMLQNQNIKLDKIENQRDNKLKNIKTLISYLEPNERL